MSENEIVQVLLFGKKSFSKDMNFRIITSSIRFIKDSKRFDKKLLFLRETFFILERNSFFFDFSIVCRCVCYDE